VKGLNIFRVYGILPDSESSMEGGIGANKQLGLSSPPRYDYCMNRRRVHNSPHITFGTAVYQLLPSWRPTPAADFSQPQLSPNSNGRFLLALHQTVKVKLSLLSPCIAQRRFLLVAKGKFITAVHQQQGRCVVSVRQQ
jgi:hypothetical protein